VSKQFAALLHRRLQFEESGQLFIGVHDEALSVVPMRISDPIIRPSLVTAET